MSGFASLDFSSPGWSWPISPHMNHHAGLRQGEAQEDADRVQRDEGRSCRALATITSSEANAANPMMPHEKTSRLPR